MGSCTSNYLEAFLRKRPPEETGAVDTFLFTNGKNKRLYQKRGGRGGTESGRRLHLRKMVEGGYGSSLV